MRPIISLAEAADAACFGGKAAGLARALQAGLPVPPGYALTPEFVAAVAEEAPAAIETLRLFAAAPDRCLRALFCDRRRFHERELCGAAQDAAQRGSRHGLAPAVREVWLSAHSAAALAYRARLGLVEAPIRIGVVLQPMLNPELAGVLFTRNPATGADERVVEAALGLGEAW